MDKQLSILIYFEFKLYFSFFKKTPPSPKIFSKKICFVDLIKIKSDHIL